MPLSAEKVTVAGLLQMGLVCQAPDSFLMRTKTGAQSSVPLMDKRTLGVEMKPSAVLSSTTTSQLGAFLSTMIVLLMAALCTFWPRSRTCM